MMYMFEHEHTNEIKDIKKVFVLLSHFFMLTIKLGEIVLFFFPPFFFSCFLIFSFIFVSK